MKVRYILYDPELTTEQQMSSDIIDSDVITESSEAYDLSKGDFVMINNRTYIVNKKIYKRSPKDDCCMNYLVTECR